MGGCCSGGLSDSDLLAFRKSHPEYFFTEFVPEEWRNLDAKTVALVRDSWKSLLECSTDELVERKKKDKLFSPITAFYDAFYGRLFERFPATNQFFKHGGIQVRAKSLISMITTATTLIDQDRWALHLKLNFLAKFHAGKGIGPGNFIPIMDAVLHALETMLTPRVFTEEVRRAWCVAYSKIISVMIPLIAGESDKGHHVPTAMPLAANSKHRNSMDGPPPESDHKSSMPDGGGGNGSGSGSSAIGGGDHKDTKAPAPAAAALVIDAADNSKAPPASSKAGAAAAAGSETELVNTVNSDANGSGSGSGAVGSGATSPTGVTVMVRAAGGSVGATAAAEPDGTAAAAAAAAASGGDDTNNRRRASSTPPPAPPPGVESPTATAGATAATTSG